MAKKPKNKNATVSRAPLDVNLDDTTPTVIPPTSSVVSTEQAYGRVQPLREPVSDALTTPVGETLVDDHQATPAETEIKSPTVNLGNSLRDRLLQAAPRMDEAPKTDLTQGGIPGYVPDIDYVGGSQVGNILKQLEETAQGNNFDGDVLKDAVNEVVLYGVRQLGEILDSENGLRAGTMLSVAYDTAMWKREDLEAKVLALFNDTALVDVYHRSPSLPRTEFVDLRNNAKLLRRVAVVFVGYSTFAFCQRPAHFPLDSEVDCALVVRHGTIQCTKLRGVFDYNKELVAF